MRSKVLAFGLLCAVAFGAWPASLTAETKPANASPDPVVIQSEKVDVSPALRDLPTLPYSGKEREDSYANSIASRENAPMPRSVGARGKGDVDPVVQRSMIPNGGMPLPNVTFEGLGNRENRVVNGFRVLPPDTNGDVGPNHYVQTVNLMYGVYNKTGSLLVGPLRTSALWTGFGGLCETRNDGDPIVLYDELADRWMISQFTANTGTPPTRQCIAISTSGDPTGTYYRYDFAYPDHFNDYPHFGVWGDAYYMTAHNFNYSGGYAGQGVVAFDRTKMLSGLPASLIYFNLGTVDPNIGGMLPADSDGYTPPPAGAPGYFAFFTANEFGDPSDGMRIFRFTANFATPASSTFLEIAAGTIPVASFDPTSPAGRADIPQPAPAVPAANLDSMSDRLMHRLAYRNFGTHESLIVTHTVDADATAAYQAAPRYYEFRRTLPAGSWAVQEQATFAPDATHRWMGSAAMDNDGNLAVGYSASSSTVMPAIRYAGRLATDPANGLVQGEAEMQAGGGVQTISNQAASRWGDYSSLNVDPSNGCTFWYTTEYYTGTNQLCPVGFTASTACWSTRIGSFTFPSCTAEEKGTLSGNVVDQDNNPIAGALVATSNGFSRTTDAVGNYTMTVGAANYSVTASKFGYSTVTSPAAVANGGVTTVNFVLVASPVLTFDSSSFTDGNANGSIDPNECIRFTVNVDNIATVTATGISATLSSATPGVTITQATSGYPDIPGSGTASNLVLFDVVTSPAFVCGTTVNFTLNVTTAQGPFVIPFSKTASGTPGSFVAFASPNVPTPITDFTTTTSTVDVTGVSGLVNAVTVSVHATHTFTGDVSLSLVAPDGITVVPLVTGRGGDSDNFGSDCAPDASRTTFDDSAATAIGAAPVVAFPGSFAVGSWRPESPLSAMRGQIANGTWTLRITDNFGADEGFVVCWTLNVQNLTCPDGGGPVAPTPTGAPTVCAGSPINLSANGGYDSYQWYLDGNLIVGATSQTYVVASATSANAGNYTVTGTSTTTCTMTSPQSAPFAVTVPSCLITPTALAVDGNGVMEAGETVALTPSWDNDGDVTLSLIGNLSAFSGPGTSSYTIIDGAGSYGSVAAGATAAASDNFSMIVSVPTARPSVHWDASVMETPGTTPSSVNSAKTWSLHMGNSFLDVATSYAFYREIETLLHNSVTLGCGDGTQYCKDNPTPRISMAVFIARAELGSDAAVPTSGMVGMSSYNCIGGGNSLYTDVAASNQFCKHVHYIASQNITSGCTTTTFCPSQNVTRIQMAIFLARALAGSDAAVPVAYSDPVTMRSYDLPNNSRAFTDLVGNTFEKHANYLWARGISNGCTGTTFCPSLLLTRGQMAKFLVGTYNMLLYKP